MENPTEIEQRGLLSSWTWKWEWWLGHDNASSDWERCVRKKRSLADPAWTHGSGLSSNLSTAIVRWAKVNLLVIIILLLSLWSFFFKRTPCLKKRFWVFVHYPNKTYIYICCIPRAFWTTEPEWVFNNNKQERKKKKKKEEKNVFPFLVYCASFFSLSTNSAFFFSVQIDVWHGQWIRLSFVIFAIDGRENSSAVERRPRDRKVAGSISGRRNFLLQGQHSVLTFISVSISTPVLSQQHVKDLTFWQTCWLQLDLH